MKSTLGSTGDSHGKRKTLVQLQSECGVRDPAAHAKLQVEELDKTAKASQLKRKKCNDQIAADMKEIENLTEQIDNLRKKYDPLCEHLKDAKERKRKLLETLEACLGDQKEIMGESKNVIVGRRQEESKMLKKMGSLELEILRGFNMKPESTFHQSRKLGDTSSSSHGNTHSSTALVRKVGTGKGHSSSVQSLPPLGSAGKSGSGGMARNQSSML